MAYLVCSPLKLLFQITILLHHYPLKVDRDSNKPWNISNWNAFFSPPDEITWWNQRHQSFAWTSVSQLGLTPCELWHCGEHVSCPIRLSSVIKASLLAWVSFPKGLHWIPYIYFCQQLSTSCRGNLLKKMLCVLRPYSIYSLWNRSSSAPQVPIKSNTKLTLN